MSAAPPPRVRPLPLVVTVVLALLAACGGRSEAASSTTTAPDPRPGPTTMAATTTSTTTTASPTTTEPPSTTTTVAPTTTTVPPTTAPPTTAAPPPPPPARPPPEQVVCIGDSVMLGAGPAYQDQLGVCGTVDAVESRQFSTAPGILAPYLGSPPQRVVLALGTNGPVARGEADAVLSSLRAVPEVVVVNTQLNGSRPWEGPVNEVLGAAVAGHDNAVLADWKGVSDGHPEYFAGDGIHMAPTGAQVYGFLIAITL